MIINPYRFAAAGTPGWWEINGATCIMALAPQLASDATDARNNLTGGSDATCSTCPTWTSGQGWVFTGTLYEGVILAGNYPSGGTVVVWATIDTAGYASAGNLWATSANQFQIPIGSSTYGWLRINGSSLAYTSYDPKGAAHVFSLSARSQYIDATLYATVGGSGYETTALGIGARPDNTYQIDGTVHAVAIYSEALTTGELATLRSQAAAAGISP